MKRVKLRGEELPVTAAGGMQTGTQIAIVGAPRWGGGGGHLGI